MANENQQQPPVEPQPTSKFPLPTGAKVVVVLLGLFGAALLLVIIVLVHSHNNVFQNQQVRTIFAGFLATAVLAAANHAIFVSKRTVEVKYVIAFDVVIFIVLGMVALISAAPYWGMASLCAGTCLFGGGIIGLLFGLPLGSETVKSQTDQAQADARTKMDNVNLATAKAIASNAPEHAPTPQIVQDAQTAKEKADSRAAGNNSRNLLSETASSLSKILAGATLARFDKLLSMYQAISLTITRSIGGNPNETSGTLGGALILYFGLIGFISGLVLPAYFMDKWQEGGGDREPPS